ncbi:hypothetical protein EDC96DRAFT_543289 [Choanephora cucurbitarum]|nr:hypothetical protein EDC96DRAFT_543289 [Choanephora cucurbitarum]
MTYFCFFKRFLTFLLVYAEIEKAADNISNIFDLLKIAVSLDSPMITSLYRIANFHTEKRTLIISLDFLICTVPRKTFIEIDPQKALFEAITIDKIQANCSICIVLCLNIILLATLCFSSLDISDLSLALEMLRLNRYSDVFASRKLEELQLAR